MIYNFFMWWHRVSIRERLDRYIKIDTRQIRKPVL